MAYAIGVAHPLSINVETFGTGEITDEKIAKLIDEHFDLRPGAIIRDLDLRRPIYRQTAAYGHFGRDDLQLALGRHRPRPGIACGCWTARIGPRLAIGAQRRARCPLCRLPTGR